MAKNAAFTVEEANRALPLVKRIVQDIQTAARRLKKITVEQRGVAVEESLVGEVVDELHELVGELEQMGCSYEDAHTQLGIVDFPSIIEGEEVMLCWRSDESSVTHYHGPEGYSGRKPIPKAARRDQRTHQAASEESFPASDDQGWR